MKAKTDGAQAGPRREAAPLPAACEALLSRPQVLAALGGISPRKLASMLSSGEFPKPDTRIGDLPRWWSRTVNGWIAAKCEQGKAGG